MDRPLLIFSTTYTALQSIFTIEKPDRDKEKALIIKDNKPVSILALAKKYEKLLSKVVVIDESITGFWQLYKKAKEEGVSVVYGFKLTLCQDHLDKSEESLSTESNFCILFKNSQAYTDAVPILTEAQTEGFYYRPRLGYQYLDDHWSKNFEGLVPFYSSAVARNSLKFGHTALPVYNNIRPIFLLQQQGLPFDELIKTNLENYCSSNKYPLLPAHWAYYYKEEDVYDWMVSMCLKKRSNMQKPELGATSSPYFSFETYQRLYDTE